MMDWDDRKHDDEEEGKGDLLENSPEEALEDEDENEDEDEVLGEDEKAWE